MLLVIDRSFASARAIATECATLIDTGRPNASARANVVECATDDAKSRLNAPPLILRFPRQPDTIPNFGCSGTCGATVAPVTVPALKFPDQSGCVPVPTNPRWQNQRAFA